MLSTAIRRKYFRLVFLKDIVMTFVEINLTKQDIKILRQLSAQLVEIGSSTHMEELRRNGCKLNRLEMERPFILFWPGGNLLDDKLSPLLECETEWARHHERQMRDKLYSYHTIGDDTIINPFYEYRSFCQ